MNTTVNFVAARLRRFLLLFAVSAMLVHLLHRSAKTDPGGTPGFEWWALLLPTIWGWMLGSVLHEAMHRPMGMLLPNAARRLFGGHVLVLAALAAFFGYATHLVDVAMPFGSAVAVAAAALTLTLPFEPGWRWAGSRIVPWIVVAGYYFAGEHVRAWTLAAPWAVTLGGFAIAAVNVAAVASPRRRRARALVPYTSLFSAVFSISSTRLRKQQATARKNFSRAEWSASEPPQTMAAWLRALRHERTDEWSMLGWLGNLVFINVAAVIVFALLKWSTQGFAHSLHSLATSASISMVPLLILFQAPLAAFPRCHWLYPLSREQRTRTIFASSLIQMLVSYALVTTILGLSALFAAQAIDLVFSWRDVAKIAVLLAFVLPFVPIIHWGQLHVQVREDRVVPVLCLLLAAFAAVTFRSYLQRPGSIVYVDVLSPAGLAWCLALIGLSQVLYYLSVKRFHRAGDLLQRGRTETGLGLV